MTVYLDSETWADLEPIEQDDGENPVVAIKYSVEFTEAMNYFRAVLAKDERSSRALDLTEKVIGLNAANYTVWAFRRECIESLGLDWADELAWVTELACDNPKNYQIWHHRRCCLTKLGGQGSEIEFLNDFLTDEDLEDGKNYHAWAHRQWLVKTYNLWDGELAFLDQMLDEDVRNNSVFNHRFFVIQHRTDMSKEVREKEIEWALSLIAQVPNNESPWAYLRGMADTFPLSSFPALVSAAESLSQRKPAPNQALELKADLLAEEGKAAEAKEMYARLAVQDAIRRRYWAWRAASVA